MDDLREAGLEVLAAAKQFLKDIVKYLPTICILGSIYLAYYAGYTSLRGADRRFLMIMATSIALIVLSRFLKGYANAIGQGDRIPIPRERFTEVIEEGNEVVIDRSRLQELIIYTNDLEDWMERRGIAKWEKVK